MCYKFPGGTGVKDGDMYECALKTKYLSDDVIQLRGRSLTTLTRVCPLLTTYLPLVDIGEVCTYSFTVTRN